MIISFFNCKTFGLLSIHLKNINYLFSHRSKQFISNFSLNKNKFQKIKNLKKNRGGFLLEIKSKKKLLAIFTITNSFTEFYELGDLIKIDKNLPRLSLAKALNLSCRYILDKNKSKSIYTYPIHLAKELFLSSGFKVFSFYRRNIFFFFSNYFFLLPFQVYQRKTYIYKKYFNTKKIFKNLDIAPTRNSLFGLKIYRRLRIYEKTNIFKPKFGLLYEFKKDKHEGDYCFVFNLKKKELKFGFEYSDNSA